MKEGGRCVTGKQNQEIGWSHGGQAVGIQIRRYSFSHTDTSSRQRADSRRNGEGFRISDT